MDTVTHHSVDKLALEHKRTLEALLGQTLEAEQQVFIFASTPGVPPDDAARLAVHDRIKERINQAQHAAEAQGFTGEQIDAVVEDAILSVRRRS